MIKHVYIHIPFCIRKCFYCSFISGFDINQKNVYINSLLKEIRTNYKSEKLKTVYFGGGTPSLLKTKDIEKILNCLNIENTAEITLEVNPETVTKQKFSDLYSLGINRISLGVQTFNNNILKQIGRIHTEKCIYKAVDTIKNAGFDNISIDLIYGLPSQTQDSFKEDLHKAISLDIKHISTYGLKIEENSYFYTNTPENIPDDEFQAESFLYLCNFLKENNFKHYEISNFARKGYESKHNLCYWKNQNYYGFGLNASGYEGNTRYKNTSDFQEYIHNPLKREEEIILNAEQKKEEEIILALRLEEGININKIPLKHNKTVEKYKQLGLLKTENNHLKLTKQGILISNEIMSEFID